MGDILSRQRINKTIGHYSLFAMTRHDLVFSLQMSRWSALLPLVVGVAGTGQAEDGAGQCGQPGLPGGAVLLSSGPWLPGGEAGQSSSPDCNESCTVCAEYTCGPGWVLEEEEDPVKATCLESGQWSRAGPRCRHNLVADRGRAR